jgi:hypothetical protein
MNYISINPGEQALREGVGGWEMESILFQNTIVKTSNLNITESFELDRDRIHAALQIIQIVRLGGFLSNLWTYGSWRGTDFKHRLYH